MRDEQPASAWTGDEPHGHLIARPGSWRRQFWLRGRNMTVGQLVAWMRANEMSPEEVADDFDVPLAQVEEALTYYETYRDLVDAELRGEKRYLQDKDYAVEPAAVSCRLRRQQRPGWNIYCSTIHSSD